MGADGVEGKVHFGGDGFDAIAFCEPLEDFDLAGGKLVFVGAGLTGLEG